MKTSLISTALTLFTAAFTTTTAAPTPAPAPGIPGVASFKLKASSSAPTGIAGRTVTWDGNFNGNLGFFNNNGVKELDAFIQYNATEGIAFYARNTVYQVYLSPTYGSPQYITKLGNPNTDPAPAQTLSTSFTVAESGEAGYVFGYDWNSLAWSACGGPDEYTLYYGTVETPGSGCTANFELDLFYD